MSPKILIVDTYYPDFIRSLPSPISRSYDEELRRVLDLSFGTFDAYSHYLTAEGWECRDVIGNHDRLQQRWAMENSFALKEPVAITLAQIETFKPDVVFIQDLSYLSPSFLETLSKRYILAGQCSCPMPNARNVAPFHVLFTSFPHYVERFKAMGVSVAEYLPLAFDPRLLVEESENKQFDVAFVGGVGKRSHWNRGTTLLERVADKFKERFVWFGYGYENLEKASPLRSAYSGQAWGRDLYSVYGRSKIVINRHGEVALNYSNNLRMYEATGMGALLVTEASENLFELFPVNALATYQGASWITALDVIDWYLERESQRAHIASEGQKYTLNNHTYAHRMKRVSLVLNSMIQGTYKNVSRTVTA